MRKLSLGLGLLLLGGIGYVAWPEPPAPPAQPVNGGSKPVELVPFLVKAKTRQIFEEWQKLAAAKSAGDRQAGWTKINLAVDAIRERLHADGRFAPGALHKAMESAARELGYEGKQATHVIEGALAGQGEATQSPAILGVLEKVTGTPAQTAPEDSPGR